MAGMREQAKAGLGAAMALAALPADASEAGISYLHATPEVRQDIGATASFLEQAGKKYGTHVFLYRCSNLGMTRDTQRTRAVFEEAKEKFKSAFPEISLFLSDDVKPGERISDMTRLMDNLSGYECPTSYGLSQLTVDPSEKAIFISVPEDFSQENYHAFSLLPSQYYKADLPSLLPDSIDWMLKHEFNHYLWDLKAKPCRAESTDACALEDEAQSDKMTVKQSTPAQKQRIMDTRAIGAMHGSHPDHNTAPFISGVAGKKYDKFIAGSREAIDTVYGMIRHNLFDAESKPVITEKTPQVLASVLESCAADRKDQPDRIPGCVIAREPRVVPALAARIDPRDLSSAAQIYLIDYFRALGREAKIEFYENEVTDYVRRRAGFEPAP